MLTMHEISGMAQLSVVPSMAESLVSSGTIPGEPPCAQRGAVTPSKPAKRATADG